MKNKIMLGHKELCIPIIQGGMGVGVSLSSLAGAVMKEGGMGVISAAHPGYRKRNFWNDSLLANIEALQEEIHKAKEISNGKGICGVNIMVASKDYEHYVKAAVEGGAEAIISGAGLPMNLPSLIGDAAVLLAPIVSSARAAKMILRSWDQRHDRCADFIVIEGPLAGGHLGFAKEQLIDGTAQTLDEILPEVLDIIKPFEDKYKKNIPVFVAGGIYSGFDIAHYCKQGATGVQMATRFITTKECDASQAFKDKIIQSKKEDIVLVKSPAGLPGRALKTTFMNMVHEDRIKPNRCIQCMKPCVTATTPYCISEALIKSVNGQVEEGLVFAGNNAWRIQSMTTVPLLIQELMEKYQSEVNS